MSEILIKNACLITCDDDIVIDDGYIKIKDHLISEVGKSSALKQENIQAIDACGRIVLPGFVNAHTHLYSQFARGMATPQMRSFVEILEGLWWKLDRNLKEEDVYLSAMTGLIEAIKSGVTTIIDHHASYGAIKGSLSAIAEAFSEIGSRGVTCFEISDRDGEKKCDQAIAENMNFVEEVSEKRVSSNYLLRAMVGLHASFTLSPSTIKKVQKANKECDAPYHIHVAEGVEDLDDAKSRYSTSVIQRLYNEGILREGTIAAHCIHVNDADIETIKKSSAFVIHNPLSNMNNAVGRAPYLKMCSAGIPVGIGTDGMSSSVFPDIKAASVIHKEAAGDPQAGWNEVKISALVTNPKILSNLFGQKFGALKPGAVADVVISDSTPFTPVTSGNYWAHVLFGTINSPVNTTIVNGRILMQNHKLTTVDEASIAKEAKKLAAQLWRRFEK